MFDSPLLAALNLSRPVGREPGPGVRRRKRDRKWHAICCLFAADNPEPDRGTHMKRQGLIAFAAAGVIVGGAWLATATVIRAQQPPPAPAAPPTQAVPPIGAADPTLQIVPVPEGKKVHLLPATLETTQWGWFNNAQPPVLRINSGDTVVMETMMHSHNQVIPGTTIEQIKKLRTDFPGRGPHTLTGPT